MTTQEISIVQQTENYLRSPLTQEEFAKALNRQMDPDQFARIMLSTYRTASAFARKASPMSWLVAAMECAQRGLRPDVASAEFYFVPRYSKHTKQIEISGQVGYQGLIQLGYRGGAASIKARCVFTGDDFDEVYTMEGESIQHRPARQLHRAKGDICLAYAIATLDNGQRIYVAVDQDRIDKAMAMSGDPRKPDEPSEVWIKHPEKMWMKTAVRDLWRFIPRTKISSEVAGYVAEDFAREDGSGVRPTVSVDWARAIDGDSQPESLGELQAAPGLEPDEGEEQ